MSEKQHRTGDLRVWHIPQIPGKPFHVSVGSLAEAALVLSALADYDLFQLRNHIKPDYCNAQGLEVFDEADVSEYGPWCEWHCTDGMDIAEHMRLGSNILDLVWEGDGGNA